MEASSTGAGSSSGGVLSLEVIMQPCFVFSLQLKCFFSPGQSMLPVNDAPPAAPASSVTKPRALIVFHAVIQLCEIMITTQEDPLCQIRLSASPLQVT